MTDTEIEIIKAEYELHEKLLSETVSAKSFGGAMASVSAFIVIEWLHSVDYQPHPLLAAVALLPLFGSAFLFFKLGLSQNFKFPAEAQKWIDWRKERQAQLAVEDWPDTSEAELRETYYGRMRTALAINRGLIVSRQALAERAGILAMIPILIVLVDVAWRFISSL